MVELIIVNSLFSFPIFRPQTGKVANVILDGADDDDDADEFLIQEKPKDALELEMEPRPTSSTNLANVRLRNNQSSLHFLCNTNLLKVVILNF